MSNTPPLANDRTRSVAARTALILETNNLRGGRGMTQAVDSLKRLVSELSRQTLPPAALAQWIVTHDGLPADACAQIAALAGREIDFVEIDGNIGYYDAKNVGFDRVDPACCDYVVFGDADCRPAADWLAQLLAPFARAAHDAPAAVAGRTSYAPTVLGVAMTSIDFMYFPSPLRDGATRNFYANNVAFRREVFARHRYEPLDGVYRAHCQVMGLRMQAAGVPIEYAPTAHTEHRFPDTRRETLKLRWMRGEDSVGLTPYLVNAYLPRRWQWLGRSGPLGPFCVMAMRLGYSLGALNRQQLPPLGAVRYLAAVAVTIGVSAVDTLGALARGAGLSRRASARRDLDALSYHRH
ncbi:glycosyltransferase family 2 protein [Burkholderia stagnalis]|uniref:glycosyltransferase family 2 protein n=1 Tax=Burkholderia stagnalis TaxID=1503054 RepID=UPI00075E3A06|nr:glycosyltransferase family 2 protein [Burkholderia stagnalis]KVX50578.1 glycosyl transferase [Burkholderia stagnalis]